MGTKAFVYQALPQRILFGAGRMADIAKGTRLWTGILDAGAGQLFRPANLRRCGCDLATGDLQETTVQGRKRWVGQQAAKCRV